MTTPYIKMKNTLEEAGFSLKCPSCNSNIKHIRVDDGSEGTTFQSDGEVVVAECFSKSNGYDEVNCTNCDEEIPEEMKTIIVDHMS